MLTRYSHGKRDLICYMERNSLEGIENTFGGCYCGFHGYTVLPDCDIEKDDIKKCARCFIKSHQAIEEHVGIVGSGPNIGE